MSVDRPDRPNPSPGLLRRWWRAVWPDDCRAPQGLFTYFVEPPGGQRRLDLRIEADGSGLLLVDTTDVLHLNRTAALVAHAALSGRAPKDIARQIARHYRLRRSRVAAEVSRVYGWIEHLRGTTDACPTCGLGDLPRRASFSTPVRAPYKVDLALGYGCNNRCGHCYNPPERRGMKSLDLAGWQEVLGRLREIGVPHVVFTGGEPTLSPLLVPLVAEAHRLTLVSGLNTNGRRLASGSLASDLKTAGLSHVQITLESNRATVHNQMTGAESFDETVAGIGRALDAGLHTITNTTLSRRNADHATEIVAFAARLGLRTIACNGMIQSGRGRQHPDALTHEELAPLLRAIRDHAAEHRLRLLWYTPTPYCRLSPLELELGARRCNAGEYSLCIEPNGDVLPCQSFYRPVGNLLTDPWIDLWQSPLLGQLRQRTDDPAAAGLPAACAGCPDLPVCGGGCPLDRQAPEDFAHTEEEPCRLSIG